MLKKWVCDVAKRSSFLSSFFSDAYVGIIISGEIYWKIRKKTSYIVRDYKFTCYIFTLKSGETANLPVTFTLLNLIKERKDILTRVFTRYQRVKENHRDKGQDYR